MKSQTTERFRKMFAAAPPPIQEMARNAYYLWAQDPSHPSLQFKKAHKTQPIFSVRVELNWRAVGILNGSEMIWFWIGPHDAYDRLLKQIQEPLAPGWRAADQPASQSVPEGA